MPDDCGDPQTLIDAPELPVLGGFPEQTSRDTLTLFGSKSVNSNIIINGFSAADFDCLNSWTADISLTEEGQNSFVIYSLNRTGVKNNSEDPQIQILLDTTPPGAPPIDQCPETPCTIVSSDTSPFPLSGTQSPDDALWINDQRVGNSGEADWSYDVTLQEGVNTFSVRLVDTVGNSGETSTIQIAWAPTETALSPPRPVSPLDRSSLSGTTPTFRWSGAQPLGKTYRIQISSSIGFHLPLTLDEVIADTNLFTPATPLPAGRFFWRVARVDPATDNAFYHTPRELQIGKSLCDFNGDSHDDLIVGSYENGLNGEKSGAVYLFSGTGSGPDSNPDKLLTGQSAEDHFGISVACAGDINGDGYADILVGAFLGDQGGEDAGQVTLYLGGESISDDPLVLTGQAPDDQFGTSVSAAGDLNGDGFDDFVVGAHQQDFSGQDAGRAYVYLGGDPVDLFPDAVLTGESAGDRFGIRVARAGDTNGDRYDDLIVGADGAGDEDLAGAGKAYLFLGSPQPGGRPARLADVILTGNTRDEAFASVAGAGDLDSDGYHDVVIGASAYSEYTPGEGDELCSNFVDDDLDGLKDRKDPDCHLGRVYIFRGGPTLMGTRSADTADLILDKPDPADGFGFSVAPGGDVNGDGYTDLLVGSFLTDRAPADSGGEICGNGVDDDGDTFIDFDDPHCMVEDAGRADLFYGGDPMEVTPGVTFLGQASVVGEVAISGQFGFALAGKGDLDGDSLGDLVIGAYLYDLGVLFFETDVGEVYLFKAADLQSSVIEAENASVKIRGSSNHNSEFGHDTGFGISVQ